MANVLLIEPDQPLAKIYKAALAKAGHKVLPAGGAQKAIEAADKTRPDVVVLELQLPGHSGVEFLYEFRSYPEWKDIPAVLHTLVPHHRIRTSQNILHHLGIAAYLYKPSANLESLIRAVDAAVLIKA